MLCERPNEMTLEVPDEFAPIENLASAQTVARAHGQKQQSS